MIVVVNGSPEADPDAIVLVWATWDRHGIEDAVERARNRALLMRAVEISLAIVEYLTGGRGSGVAEIARDLGLPKTTAFRALKSLQAAGWAEPYGDLPRWRVSPAILAKFWRAADGQRNLLTAALPIMTRVSAQTEETVLLMIRSEVDMLVLRSIASAHVMRPFFPVGYRAMLHETTGGLAVMSDWEDRRVDDYLVRVVPPGRGHKANCEQIWRRVREARTQGYACRNFGPPNDLVGVGVSLKDLTDDGSELALVVAAPLQRMPVDKLTEVGQLLVAAVKQISGHGALD